MVGLFISTVGTHSPALSEILGLNLIVGLPKNGIGCSGLLVPTGSQCRIWLVFTLPVPDLGNNISSCF